MPPKRKANDALPDNVFFFLAVRPPPRRSGRQATKMKADSASALPKLVLRSGGDEDNSRGRNENNLSNEALVSEDLKMVMNKERAELIIFSLMRAYSFSYPQLKELLMRKLVSLCCSLDLNTTNSYNRK